MTRARLPLILLLTGVLALAAGTAVGAGAKRVAPSSPVVGIGDEQPTMFHNLGVRRAAHEDRPLRDPLRRGEQPQPQRPAAPEGVAGGREALGSPAADRLLPLRQDPEEDAERRGVHEPGEEVPQGVPAGQAAAAVERGQPRQRQGVRQRLLLESECDAVGSVLPRAEAGVPEVHDRRTRRAGLDQRGGDDPLHQRVQGAWVGKKKHADASGACTTTPTPTASARPRRARCSPTRADRCG